MAAIDKLYVHSYYEYDDLRRWAIAYYPELLFYFYDITLTWSRYAEDVKEWVINEKKIRELDFGKNGKYLSINKEIETILNNNMEAIVDADCSTEEIKEKLSHVVNKYETIIDQTLEGAYTFPVMNTPFSVDKKLKWICPVPCVREYLHKQCGVNPKCEWFYKLFWRGKKHFE